MKKFAYGCYLLIATFFLTEVVIRYFDHLIPSALAYHLSPSALTKLHNNHGQLQREPNGFFHYRPQHKIPYHPWIVIDENGFRNSSSNQTSAEIILLGDSIIFSRDSRVDIGEHFRNNGKSAVNLGIEGYAPQHYRDVYRRMIIDKSIPHKYVLINVFVGNDFADKPGIRGS